MHSKTKKQLYTVTALAALISLGGASARAEGMEVLGGTLTGNLGATTDYVFRGISQSDENLALQGGMDYSRSLTDDVSFYAGVWASSVDFNDGDEASVEADLYTGATFSTDFADFTLGAVYYAYPGADSSLDYDFVEIMGKVSKDFGFAAADASVSYSPDFFAGSDTAYYYQANATVPFAEKFYAKAHAGRQAVSDNATFLFPDYTDWSLGLGFTAAGFDANLSYIDTNIDTASCPDLCDSRVVFTLTKKF